jgi:hypothetical protein
VDDEMGKGPHGPKRGDGQVSEDEEGAKGSEPHLTVRWRIDGKMTRQGGGLTFIKHRKTEDI